MARKASAAVAYLDTVRKEKQTAWRPNKPIRRRIRAGRTPAGKRVNHYVVVEHTRDPKAVLLEKMGQIPDGVVQFSRILVAIYMPPVVNKTAGGIHLTDHMEHEDLEEYLWQGKVGLIVHMGPQSYVDDDKTQFYGTKNNVGDWVWFRPSDGIMCDVNEVPCRILREGDIIGKIPHPDYIW